MILNDDSRNALAAMAARGETVHSIVTDPPYGLVSVVKRFGKEGSAPAKSEGPTGVYRRASAGFMGQAWDGTGIEQDPTFWRLCYDVLLPGGHLLAFGGTRTWHRIACAIEDAGFEVRDSIMWLYGTGFPKSHDVSKGIDAKVLTGGSAPKNLRQRDMGEDYRPHELAGTEGYGDGRMSRGADTDRDYKNAPPVSRPEAAEWTGWGTALKPAWEPIIVARKPLIGTVATNVLAYGTGALNIDGCRVEMQNGETNPSVSRRQGAVNHLSTRPAKETEAEGKMVSRQSPDAFRRARSGEDLGRWPANVVHDGSPEVLEAFALYGKAGGGFGTENRAEGTGIYGKFSGATKGKTVGFGDSGTAARFFYTTKASKKDRNTDWQGNPLPYPNAHPTVKPTDLMQWLVRLVTPPGGTVLDPFCGSGSTGVAARREGFGFIGIEQDPRHADFAAMRVGGSDFEAKMARLREAIRRNEEARNANQ